jgi:esterase/lipase superfamily enzyme
VQQQPGDGVHGPVLPHGGAGARDAGQVPLLTVHGFCYSFTDAIARAGQIAAFYDAGPFAVELAPLAFCWPSAGALDNDTYPLDRASCERSDEALAALVRDIGAAGEAAGVRPVLLAHSSQPCPTSPS